MLDVERTTNFRRNLKRIAKRGYNLDLLTSVVNTLRAGLPLDTKHCDHQLTGDMRTYRECHIQADWLLIYRIDKGRLVLVLSQTGTHADLFKK